MVPQVSLSLETYKWDPSVRGKPENEKGLKVHWALNTIGPARWPNSTRLKEVGRLRKRLTGRLGAAKNRRAGSGTRLSGLGRQGTSGRSPLLFLFFSLRAVLGPTGHRRPTSPPLSSSFHWRAGPAWQCVLLLFLLLSPPPTDLAGAHGQGRGLCGGEVKARRGQAGL